MTKAYDATNVTVTWNGVKFAGYDSKDVLEVPGPDDREGAPWVVASVTAPLVRVGPSINLVQMVLSSQRRWKRGQKLNRGGRRRAQAKHAEGMKAAQERWVQSQIDAAYVGLSMYGPMEVSSGTHRPWAAKTAEEVLEDLRDVAAKFSGGQTGKDGEQ